MKRTTGIVTGLASLALVAGGLFAVQSASAEATATNPCNVQGFTQNPDESANAPTYGYKGATFEGKDLVHHTAPSGGIDFPDMDKVKYSFTATGTADKLAFKVETSAPYSTIITVPGTGKLWSTAMTYDQVGGQGNPVDKYTDFLGLDTKPGKAKFSSASEVETFGVGHWTEDGTATLTSLSFHGTNYSFNCKVSVALVQARYNPSGTDIGANLQNEYVQIQNKGAAPVNLNGYTVRNRAAKVYTFGDVTLNAGAKLAIRTGVGTATATSVYQGSTDAQIWLDSDAATLRNDVNGTLDSCVWTGTKTGLTAC